MKKIAKQGIFPIIMVMGRNDMAIPKEESYTKEFEINQILLKQRQKENDKIKYMQLIKRQLWLQRKIGERIKE